MRAKAVLFDKDGTLFDFQRTWAPWVGRVIDRLAEGDAGLAAALARAWDYDPEARRIGPGSIVIAGDVGQVAAAVSPLLPRLSPADLLAFLDETGARVVGAEVVPLAGFLGRLAALGLALGVATNDTEAAARAQLRRAGIADRFARIAGYDSGHGGKPGPGMCLAFAAHVGLAPAQIVMVGDSAHDMRAGRAAGMQTVAVLTGPATRAELAPLADTVLPDIGHLEQWLARPRG